MTTPFFPSSPNLVVVAGKRKGGEGGGGKVDLTRLESWVCTFLAGALNSSACISVFLSYRLVFLSCALWSLHPLLHKPSTRNLLFFFLSFLFFCKKKPKTCYYDNSTKTRLELIQPFTETMPGSWTQHVAGEEEQRLCQRRTNVHQKKKNSTKKPNSSASAFPKRSSCYLSTPAVRPRQGTSTSLAAPPSSTWFWEFQLGMFGGWRRPRRRGTCAVCVHPGCWHTQLCAMWFSLSRFQTNRKSQAPTTTGRPPLSSLKKSIFFTWGRSLNL